MANLAALGGERAAAALAVPRWPVTGEEEREALLAVLEAGQWCRLFIDGPVAHFEREWAAFQDARRCVAVGNGTEAIELALLAAGVGRGDEVIVTALTFIASATAITEIGAVPIFVDVDPETFSISTAAVEAAITGRTRAVVAVHYGGYPVDLDALVPLCRQRGLALVEDCAHAHGTEWRGRKVGAQGTAGTFSFQMSKSLAAGEGGAVVTDDEALADRALLEHNIGRVLGQPGYDHLVASSNYRLSEFQGAILRCQLARLPQQTAHKHANGVFLAEALRQIGAVLPLRHDDRITQRGYYFMVLRYQAEACGGVARDVFVQALRAEGVPCGVGYGMPVYRNPAFVPAELNRKLRLDPAALQPYDQLHLPAAEQACAEQITLSHTTLLADRAGMQAIADAVAKVQANVDELRQLAR